ncbi:MAG: right-handed parallel beta-helix repeat-containing protein [Myxococcales bacterium]|nr:right-handed parallel beta-helix repeat-containing protein [Myxococcales bacterium]
MPPMSTPPVDTITRCHLLIVSVSTDLIVVTQTIAVVVTCHYGATQEFDIVWISESRPQQYLIILLLLLILFNQSTNAGIVMPKVANPSLLRRRIRQLLLFFVLSAAIPAPAFALTLINYTTLGQNTIWGPSAPFQADTEYVLQTKLIIDQGYSLTIQPGVKVLFAPNASITVGAGTTGTLVVSGQGPSPVLLDAESGTAGSWTGLILTAKATNVSITHTQIKKAIIGIDIVGAPGVGISNTTVELCTNRNLRIQNASPVVSNSTFRQSQAIGVDILDAASIPLWTGNTVGLNGSWHIQTHPNAVAALAGGTAFLLNTLPSKWNAIRILGGTTLQHSGTWPSLGAGMSYSLANPGIVIAAPAVPVLTIGPGATVKIDNQAGTGNNSGSYIQVGSASNADAQGGLLAYNTVFTSSLDDTIGGDTNGDGATTVVAGLWNSIVFLNYALDSSTLDGCTVRYGGAVQGNYFGSNGPLGSGSLYGGVTISAANITLSDTTIESNDQFGVRIHTSGDTHLTNCTVQNSTGAGVYEDGSGTVTLTDCVIQNNGGIGVFADPVLASGTSFQSGNHYPISIDPNSVAGLVNPANNNTFVAKKTVGHYNGIEVRAGVITNTGVWSAVPGFVYTIRGGDIVSIQGNPLPTLTIGEGAIVKFGPSVGTSGANGTYLVVGHASNAALAGRLIATGAVFTALADDQHGGDLLGDGPTTVANGSYGGIVFFDTAADDSSLTDCTIRYGGASQGQYFGTNGPLGAGLLYGNITITGASPTISNCEIENAHYAAIRIATSGSVKVENTTIHNNTVYGILDEGTGPLLMSDCSVTNTAGYGVFGNNATITGTTFAKNALYPVSLTAASIGGVAAPASGNVFVPNTSPVHHNALVARAGVISKNDVWPDISPLAYVIEPGNIVSVQGTIVPTLSIEDNAVVKFGPHASTSGANGTYLMIGTTGDTSKKGRLVADGAIFTALDDDAYAGDTLGDGQKTLNAGLYGGIILTNQAAATSSISNCLFRHGGVTQGQYFGTNGPLGAGNLYGCVTIDGPAMSITNSTFENCDQFGVRIHSGKPVLDGLSVYGGKGTAIYDSGPGPVTVIGSQLQNNAVYGLYANEAVVLGTLFSGNTSYPVSVMANSVSGIVSPLSGNTFVPRTIPADRNAIEIRGGTISASGLWPHIPSFSYYIQDGTIVWVQGNPMPTLAIGSGAVVKFGLAASTSGANGTYLALGHASNAALSGKLVATGAIFTVSTDDSIAGDTTGNGPTAPAAGSYGGILLMETADDSSTIEGCTLKYGGQTQGQYFGTNAPLGAGSVYGCVTLAGVNAKVTNSTFQGCGTAAIYVHTGAPTIQNCSLLDGQGHGVYDAGSGPLTVSNCTINGNKGHGVYANNASITGSFFLGNANYPISLTPNSIAGLTAPGANNTWIANSSPAHHNAIFVRGGTMNQSGIWGGLPAGFTYVLEPGTITTVAGNPMPTLEFSPGTIVKFGPAASTSGANGTYIVVGHDTNAALTGKVIANGALFTSLADDTVGGDTENNGPTTIPTGGNYGGFVLLNLASDTSSFTASTFRYGGQTQGQYFGTNGPLGTGLYGAVTLVNAAPTINGCVFSNGGAGIRVTAGNAVVTGCTLQNNTVGMLVQGGAPQIHESQLVGNTSFGVQNLGALVVDATQNWWGSSTGPTHTTNPGGTGDAVTNLVLFNPWKTISSDLIAPGPIGDLQVIGVGIGTVLLTWTAPGDNGFTGTADAYDIRYSTSPITQATFGTAIPVGDPPTPVAAGDTQTWMAGGLPGGNVLYFAMKTIDAGGNPSVISNNTDNGPPVLVSMTPLSSETGTEVALTVSGTHLFPDATLSFVGTSMTVAAPNTVTTGTSLTTTVDLEGVPPGQYSVVVTNADGKSGNLAAKFVVKPVSVPPLAITPEGPQLVVAGDNLQFGIIGNFVPVSWSSSEPAVGIVDNNGLFTAVSSTTATTTTVTATNAGGGKLTSGLITVPLDFDNDGLKDSWETANGLNPKNPLDALGDPDGDTLTTGDEYKNNTDPFVFNPTLRVDSLVGGANVYADGTWGYPGRFVGPVQALAAVDTVARPHFVTVWATGYGTARAVGMELAESPVEIEVSPNPHSTPVAYGEPTLADIGILTGLVGPISVDAVDWNLDGDMDLVLGDGTGGLWITHNVGDQANPVWETPVAIETTGQPILLGAPTDPILVDWNGDRLLDLAAQESSGRFRFYMNTGSPTQPQFDQAPTYVQVPGPGNTLIDLVRPVPARPVVVDWNGDGNRDWMVGRADGHFELFLNVGTDNAPVLSGPTLMTGSNNTAPLDAGQEATPWFSYDLDGKGSRDLISGNGTGQVLLWTAAISGLFSYNPIQVIETDSTGRTVPMHLDWDGDGTYDLVLGQEDGTIRILPGLATIDAPTGVQASGTPDYTVVAWLPNQERGLEGYKIYRATAEEGPYIPWSVVGLETTLFKDFQVELDTPYWYKVTAFSALGESAPSTVVMAKAEPIVAMAITPPGPHKVVTGGTLQLAATGGITPYFWIVTNDNAGWIDDDGLFTATGFPTVNQTSIVIVLDALNNAALSGVITVPWDYDQDGLGDHWELDYGFDPTIANGADDPDGDGLKNDKEYQLNTDPLHPDTDGDQLEDGYEVNVGLDPLVDDSLADPDGDGLSNLKEMELGTLPFVDDRKTDHDGDFMFTAWEALQGTDPFVFDASDDPDGDGLPNLVEHENTTPPTVDNLTLTDQDNDGMPDMYEQAVGLHPLIADFWTDPDLDLMPTGIEYLNGTSPYVPNSALLDGDGDGLPTRWEAAYGTDWNTADATADPDLDAIPNTLEFLSGLLPLTHTDLLTDTDQDGLPDRYERVMGRNPLVANAGNDPDQDDKPDLLEMTSGANPDVANTQYGDMDGDGMPNYWERAFAPDLNWQVDDALGNPDFDNIKSIVEWLDGTSPMQQANDTDNDDMADIWELAWGVDDPQGNPDNDIFVNLNEFLDGTNPLKVDPYTIVLTPTLPIVMVGETIQFAVGASVAPLVWATSDNAVATIDGQGKLTGVSLGWVEVTVTDQNAQVGTTLAFVYPKAGLENIPLVVAPIANQIVVAGDTVDFEAFGGEPPYSWSVLNPNWATVNTNGVFVAKGSQTQSVTTRVVVQDSNGASVQSGILTIPYDHDGDGMNDAWEVIFGLDPHQNDAVFDPDHDGSNNICEWLEKTNPHDPGQAVPCESNCCEGGLLPGCNDPGVQTCVCGFDPACCLLAWDDECADIASEACGGGCCGNGVCTLDESCATCSADCGPCQVCSLELVGDVNGDNFINVSDTQCGILTSLWVLDNQSGPPPGCLKAGNPKYANVDCDSSVTIVDVNLIISLALGAPLNPLIDANANKCPDSCEL